MRWEGHVALMGEEWIDAFGRKTYKQMGGKV
jgi:hypothetical protein